MALVSVLPALSGGGGAGVGGEAGLVHRSPLRPAFLACAEPAGLRDGLGPPRIRPHLHSCGRRSDALHCVPQVGSGPHGPHTGVQGDSLFGNVRQTAQRRFKVLMVTVTSQKAHARREPLRARAGRAGSAEGRCGCGGGPGAVAAGLLGKPGEEPGSANKNAGPTPKTRCAPSPRGDTWLRTPTDADALFSPVPAVPLK